MISKGNKRNLGFIENIIFDFNKNVLPLDNFNNYDFVGFTFSEITQIKKYYNLSLKYGVNSKYYLKLCFIVFDIIKKHNKNFLGFKSYFEFKERFNLN